MRKVLIDLDSLLDTRLGVLAGIDETATQQVIASPAYWNREHTDWAVLTNGKVTNDTFHAAWVARGKADLQRSVMTGIMVVLSRVLTEYNRNMQEGVVEEDVCLEVNLYPYELEYEEHEALEEVLHELLYPELTVSFCYRPMEELTPKVMNDHYAAVFLYDFPPWIKHHCFNLGKQRCPGLNVIVPKLFERNPHDLTKEQKQDEVFGFRLWLMEYIDFEFVDVEWFSMLRPSKEKTA